MSRYETLRAELGDLRMRQAFAVMVPAIAIAVFTVSAADSEATRLLMALLSLVVLPLILHRVWRLTFPKYREWSDRSSNIRGEIAGLQKRIASIFEKYRERQKGERFKQAYDLAGRSVHDLEEALSVGMFRERREVFVTAFMRRGMAVRVTASIGSPFRCSATDDPTQWKDHTERLACDEIRQYHNHQAYNGTTRPSPRDIKSAGALKLILGPHGPKLHSLIICWNDLREWKVFEYDEAGRQSLHFEFDAAVVKLRNSADSLRPRLIPTLKP
jgi:hypothetical protein